MKKVIMHLCIMSLLWPASCLAELFVITKDNVDLLYESRSDKPIPSPILASRHSMHFRDAKSKQIKADLLKDFERKLLGIARDNDVSYTTSGSIDLYDSKKKGYTLSGSPYHRHVALGQYVLEFTNFDDFKFLDVPESKSRELASVLESGLIVDISIRGILTDIDVLEKNDEKAKILKIKIVSISVDHYRGEHIGFASIQ